MNIPKLEAAARLPLCRVAVHQIKHCLKRECKGKKWKSVINRSLSKWLLGCAISPYVLQVTPFLFLCVSSLFNSFHPNFCCD
jgi:hypothetical protein